MDALKSRLRAILYPPGTNPLNWKILFIVFCSVVGETLSLLIYFGLNYQLLRYGQFKPWCAYNQLNNLFLSYNVRYYGEN